MYLKLSNINSDVKYVYDLVLLRQSQPIKLFNNYYYCMCFVLPYFKADAYHCSSLCLSCLLYSHSGEQCCYDTQGRYISDSIAAGSADYYYPLDNYLLHQSSDYFPYRACCIDSNDANFCDLYYQIRPKSNTTCQPVVTRIGTY